ncbi:MAG: hypothetical protein ACRDRN_11910 [Sciscionella sp.]
MKEWWGEFVEHDGLIRRDRVLAEVDPDRLLVALRSGRLRRVQRGIYLPRTVEYVPWAAARAALISSGIPDAVASHRTAGRLHLLALPEERRCEDVTVALTANRKDRKDLAFHTRSLKLGETLIAGIVPVTSIPRTLADLAESLDRFAAVWALDDAMRRKLCTRLDIERAVSSWRGGAGCRLVPLRLGEADGMAESVLETTGRLKLKDAGVPLPVPQYRVYASGGREVARLDGAYPECKLGLEYDGRSVHDTPDAVFRDRARQNDLAALGWMLLRFTWWDVMADGAHFVRTVERTIRAA